MLTIPTHPKLLTFITILFGIAFFFWISAEDSIWSISVLGWAITLLAIAHFVFRFSGKLYAPQRWIPAALILGMMTGVGAVAATILLMVIKTSLESDVYPEYSWPAITGILDRLPAWALAGAFLGLASVIYLYRPKNKAGQTHQNNI